MRYISLAIALAATAANVPLEVATAGQATSPSTADAPVLLAAPQLVDIGGGRRINTRCMGEGSPTVLMTSGLGDHMGAWTAIQPKVSQASRTCAWDRAGLGASDPSTEPQDATHTTGDLEKLLAAMNIPPPYVLVGHSLGSFETLLFAYRHPEQVAGIVLVDPSTPFMDRAFVKAVPAFGTAVSQGMKDQQVSMSKCIEALEAGKESKECDNAPVQPGHRNQLNTIRAVLSMAENLDASSGQVDQAKRPLGDIPIIVLTAGKWNGLPDDLVPKVSAAWNHMHDELAALSTKGINRQVPDAAHYIQRGNPDAVIAAVNEVVAAARARSTR